MEEYRMILMDEEFIIPVIRMKRKSLSLTLKDGQFLCKVPYLVRERDIIRFLDNHRSWMFSAITAYREKESGKRKIPGLPDRPLTGSEKRVIKDFFEDRTAYFAKQMQLDFGTISIRNQKTRWGSCSSVGNLNFNYKLYFLPGELRDYVIIHELCHRVYMNHSPQFWGLVEQYCPDYKQLKKRLREFE